MILDSLDSLDFNKSGALGALWLRCLYIELLTSFTSLVEMALKYHHKGDFLLLLILLSF